MPSSAWSVARAFLHLPMPVPMLWRHFVIAVDLNKIDIRSQIIIGQVLKGVRSTKSRDRGGRNT